MLAVLAAGCGQAAAAVTSHSDEPKQAVNPPAVVRNDVLGFADLGFGWVFNGTPASVSLQTSMKDDSTATKRIERNSYRAGYKASFTTGHGQAVVSAAFDYATGGDARAVAAGWVSSAATALPGARRIHASSSTLGDHEALWAASGTSNGHHFPIYLAQWVRGSVIATLALAGGGTTETQLLRLAHLQDERLAGHPPNNQLPGEAAKPATQVLADVDAAIASAHSVHMHEATRGQVLDFHAGQQTGEGTVSIQASKVEQLRRVGRSMWVNANRAYYSSVSATAAARLAGQWISIPPSSPGYLGGAKLTNIGFELAMVTPGAGAGIAAPRTIGTARLHGELVIVIYMQNTGGLATTVYVPADGTPLPIQIDQYESGAVGRIMLSGWNQPLTVARPAHPISSSCACS